MKFKSVTHQEIQELVLNKYKGSLTQQSLLAGHICKTVFKQQILLLHIVQGTSRCNYCRILIQARNTKKTSALLMCHN